MIDYLADAWLVSAPTWVALCFWRNCFAAALNPESRLCRILLWFALFCGPIVASLGWQQEVGGLRPIHWTGLFLLSFIWGRLIYLLLPTRSSRGAWTCR